MTKAKTKLKIAMLEAGIDYQYQLAEILGMREESLSRKLRTISDDELETIIEKIRKYMEDGNGQE